jgi:putative membrane protein
MNTPATILIALVALLHFWFMILEMFLWRKPRGLRTFGLTQDFADSTAVLAANQGLYNGFLVAGLIWGLLASDPTQAHSIRLFFLSCVVVAGIYGGLTANKRIFYIQALPALIALAFLELS